jgi:type I restriction enzyme M protein
MKPDTGRCAILFPHGILFRDEEMAMRKELVRSDLVECVIGIGKNLFYNSPMEACIVVCRANKPLVRRGKILFINAVKEVTRKNAQSFLEDRHIEKIANVYANFEVVEGFSAIETTDEILKNDGKLSIALYVDKVKQEESASVEDITAEWIVTSGRVHEEINRLAEMLEVK